MSLLIDDPETLAAIEALAESQSLSTADAVKTAIANERLRMAHEADLVPRLKALSAKVTAYPATGLKADKAFFDELGGDL